MPIFQQEPHQPRSIQCRVRAAPKARPIRRLSRCLRLRESIGATVACRPRLWVCGLATEAMQGRGRWPWHDTGTEAVVGVRRRLSLGRRSCPAALRGILAAPVWPHRAMVSRPNRALACYCRRRPKYPKYLRRLLLGHCGTEAFGEVLAGQLLEPEELMRAESVDFAGQHRVEVFVVKAETTVVARLLAHVAHEAGIPEGVDTAAQTSLLGVG